MDFDNIIIVIIGSFSVATPVYILCSITKYSTRKHARRFCMRLRYTTDDDAHNGVRTEQKKGKRSENKTYQKLFASFIGPSNRHQIETK